MLKKSMKIVAVLLIAVMAVMVFSNIAFASDFVTYTPKPKDTSTASTSVQNMSNAILAVVQTVGMAVAVIMLIVLAIKYISAAPSDKAEIKKHAVVYVVGAVVLFSASALLGIIRQFAGNIK